MADDGTWYVLLHNSNDFEVNLDCTTGKFASPQCNISLLTNVAFDNVWVGNILRLFTAICGGKSR
jgi:hypothetical protein